MTVKNQSAPPTYLKCEVSVTPPDGNKVWMHDHQPVFLVTHDGKLLDMRTKPPFLSMSPCPYCGAEGPQVAGIKGHDPLKHIQRAEWVGDKEDEKV